LETWKIPFTVLFRLSPQTGAYFVGLMNREGGMAKDQAQRRVDRICAFREELETLHNENVLVLDEVQEVRLKEYHQSLLDRYASLYDVDVSGAEKQLSWGMRIVSFLGALALPLCGGRPVRGSTIGFSRWRIPLD
jgi:hypothetical protein